MKFFEKLKRFIYQKTFDKIAIGRKLKENSHLEQCWKGCSVVEVAVFSSDRLYISLCLRPIIKFFS